MLAHRFVRSRFQNDSGLLCEQVGTGNDEWKRELAGDRASGRSVATSAQCDKSHVGEVSEARALENEARNGAGP